MVRFGTFEFDSVRRRLMRAGEEVQLTPQAFALRALLIEASAGMPTVTQVGRASAMPEH